MAVTSDTDRLVRQAAAGDVAACDQLFLRHRDRLKRMIHVRLDPRLARRLDSSDIVQEILLEASKRLNEYAACPKLPFYPWLRQLAWDRLVEVHRWHYRHKRSVSREDSFPQKVTSDSIANLAERLVARSDSPSANAIRHEMLDRIRIAMDQLDPLDCEILTLRHLEQLSTSDAAAVAGISVAAAKSRHFRAIQRLLTELQVEGNSHG